LAATPSTLEEPPRSISPVFLHLDDTRPDTDHIERAISLREAVAASIIFHVGLILLML